MGQSTLFVVATPIGNLQDISQRALDTLRAVDCIAAEDTRRTGTLLAHYGISRPLVSLHEHNEDQVAPRLVERLGAGESVALVSDAGTPLVSDPGFRLVRLAAERGVAIRTVPGPSALTAALSVSGVAVDRFTFEGFLPPKAAARRKRLEALASETRTLVFYEASHRVVDTLADLEAIFGATREAAVCRELTKRYETVRRDTLAALHAWVAGDADQQRGEFVLVVAGAPEGPGDLGEALSLARALTEYLSPSQAARVAAKLTGHPRRDLFAALEAGGTVE